jgi:hypothetical protein
MTEQEILLEINEIKKWLQDHDYIVIKYICGEYDQDAEKWYWYIGERKNKKERLDELERLLVVQT